MTDAAQHKDAAQHRPRPLPLFLDLVRRETAANPERLAAALAGLRAYQQAPRAPAAPLPPAVATAGRAVLRDYGGGGRPVVVVPSLINSPAVLDMPGRSLLRALAAAGLRPLLVDWGTPDAGARDMDMAGHVEALLLPLVEAAGREAALVGYCLGGTLALGAAAVRPVAGLALIAAPWRFAGYPDAQREGLDTLWQGMRPAAEALGLCPLEMFQAGFWQLDPARTVAKFERFGQRDPGSEEAASFIAVEDWANDGPPLTLAAGRDIVETFMQRDRPGSGDWRIDGRAVRPDALGCPLLEIVSTTDRIVPAASAAAVGSRLDLALGHVGMVVGGRAERMLWRPLATWLLAL